MNIEIDLIGISLSKRPIETNFQKIHNMRPFINMIPYKSPIGFDLRRDVSKYRGKLTIIITYLITRC